MKFNSGKISFIFRAFVLFALILSVVVASFDVRAATTLITPSNLNWGFVTEGGSGTGSYSAGPATHTGSAKLVTGGSSDGVVFGGLLPGFPLASITVLKYDAYRASGPANVVPNINLEVDFDSTDGFDGTSVYQGRLVFIPGGTINEDTWYTFDALAGSGVWYTSPASLDAATTNYCTLNITSGCTWAQLMSYWPNMNLLSSWADEVGSPGTGMAGFKAGSGWSTPFEGYVDNFVINSATYNFEPSIPPVYNITQDTYYLTIPDAVSAANPGDTIEVAAGTYVLSSQLDLNKANLTLNGAGSGLSIIQVSGTGYRLNISAPGVTINGFGIQKTDKVGVQNIIYVGANNVSITNNEIWGQYVFGDGDVSRAMEFPGGLSGLNISGNTIHNLRQPAYINGVSTGTISNNYTYLTRGWVVAGGDLTFTNNTWGTGANANIYDIVLLSSVSALHYSNVPAMSAANNNAFIEDQRTSPATLSIVYVDGSVAVSGDGTARSPKKTIAEGITRVAPGGTIYVLPGTYAEDLVINKPLSLLGPNAAINPNTGSRVAEAILHPATTGVDPYGTCTVMAYLSVSNITIKGFTFDGDNPGLTSGVNINGADVDACEVLAGYEGMGNITVENNILEHATYAGIDFYNYYNSAATTNNYIRYNRFEDIGTSTYGYGMGVLIYNNFYAAITDNVMTGVRVGIQTGNFSQANPGTTNSISNNQISSWRLGVFHNLWYSSATPLTISNNAITAENYTGAVNYSGILLSSMGTTVGATVTGNTITVPVTDTHSGYTAGYNVWNVQDTAPITISGGTVTGGDYGVFVNNYEGYTSNANNTSIIVNGVTILASDIAGIYVKDSDDNTNGATVFADVQSSTIDTNATGILVYGPQASAKANFNRLSGNPTAGITNGNTSFTMDGTYNWWGSATGPGPVGLGTGVNVSTFVNFTPWCADSTCTTFAPGPAAFEKTSPAHWAVGQSGNPGLSWNTSAGAVNYEYCVDELNNNTCDTAWVSTSGATSAAPLLAINKTYYWQVRALNAVNGVTYANAGGWWVFITAPGSFVQITPAHWSAGQPATPNLTWGASIGATDYEYCVDLILNSSCDTSWVSTSGATSATPTLLANKTYYWQVRALSVGGYTYTAWRAFQTQPGTLNKTSPTHWSPGHTANPTLTWSASNGATDYEYCVDEINNNSCDTSWVSTSGAVTASPALVANKVYYWQVRAVAHGIYTMANGGGWWVFRTQPGAFNKMSPSHWAGGQSLTPTLTWTASLGAAGYEYCISTTAGGCTTWIPVGNVTTIVIGTPLLPNTAYYWQVRAVNATTFTLANSGGIWVFVTGP